MCVPTYVGKYIHTFTRTYIHKYRVHSEYTHTHTHMLVTRRSKEQKPIQQLSLKSDQRKSCLVSCIMPKEILCELLCDLRVFFEEDIPCI